MERGSLDRRRFLERCGAGLAALGLSGCGRVGANGSASAAPGTAPAPEPKISVEKAMAKALRTGLLTAAVYKEHEPGEGHPEAPARLDAIAQALAPLRGKLSPLEARPAAEEEILYCHGAEYFKWVKEDLFAGCSSLRTGDTNVSRKSLEAALAAAGGAMNAVDAVLSGKVKNAFCAVRPPGHHAASNRGMGFCIFNNVALAARYAQRKHKLAKVLIADWDVHHGNGTQEIFWKDGTVFFLSTHQFPWYPGSGRKEETGEGPGAGCIMNRPFPAGAGRREILGVFQDELVPAAAKFKPDLVLISAGFDSRDGDPLGGFKLTDEDFRDLTRVMLAIAKEHAQGRVLSLLEGGYDLEGLGKAVAAHVGALAEG